MVHKRNRFADNAHGSPGSGFPAPRLQRFAAPPGLLFACATARALGTRLEVGARAAQRLRVRVVVASAFREGDDVIADRGEAASADARAAATPRLAREELLAQLLQLAAADARRRVAVDRPPGDGLVRATAQASALRMRAGARRREGHRLGALDLFAVEDQGGDVITRIHRVLGLEVDVAVFLVQVDGLDATGDGDAFADAQLVTVAIVGHGRFSA